MKKVLVVAGLVWCLAALASSEALAQGGMRWRGSEGWGPGTAYGRMYDPKSVITLRGEVVSVDTFVSKGMSPGVHVTLKTAEETLPVHLGPEWYISAQDTKIAPGDTLEVRGSRIMFEGKPAIIAAQVTRGAEVLVLRDDSGFPAWAGWRRRK